MAKITARIIESKLAMLKTNDIIDKLDIEKIRADFPILSQKIRGKDLIFLDTAASAQKPKQVINAMKNMAETGYANIHRGMHSLSIRADEAYESARIKVANFIGAEKASEIIFTRNATESINLVAQSWAKSNIKKGESIIISEMEHHANIVPWVMLAEKTGIELLVTPLDKVGQIDMAVFEKQLTENKVKLVSLTAMSNVTGIEPNIEKITSLTHKYGAKILIDGCQSIVHKKLDVKQQNIDFFVFSSHKLYGPTGIGVLYAKEEILKEMPPWQGGGGMIDKVTFEKITYADAPTRFEAGTPAIMEAIGLAAAIDYIESIGIKTIAEYEKTLGKKALSLLNDIKGIEIYGNKIGSDSIISFNLLDNENNPLNAADCAMLADGFGIALRSGHHCAQPLMRHYKINGCLRASIGLYNKIEEVESLAIALPKIRSMLL